jgi:photosystem II PsbZ protein
MIIVFQLALLALVLYSLVMVVAVPVLYSSAVDGSRSKTLILLGSLIWVGMVIAVATLNFLK